MVVGMLALGILPAPAAEQVEPPAAVDDSPASETPTPTAEPTSAVPWSLLKDRRLLVTTRSGTTATGTFLGLDNGNAILEADDGTLVVITASDVASVRTVKPPPPAPAPVVDPFQSMSLAFREEDARRQLRRTEGMARATRGASIAGGVIASLSAVSSVVAEGFNIKRWSLSTHKCGESYYSRSTVCGWTDGADTGLFDTPSYDYYDNMLGIAGASTVAIPLHAVAGPTILIPSALLRNRIGYHEGRGRQIAAWVLWGAGLGSLVGNQAVSWTQVWNSQEICKPGSGGNDDCAYVTPTRGAPPPLYLLSAGLTLSSAILGIIDAQKVARHAERASSTKTTTKLRSAPTLSLFPFRLHAGGGLGFAGRF